MDEKKLGLLAGAFVLCLLLLGGAWYFKQQSDRAERIAACVSLLGEQGRARCELMDSRR